MATYLTLTPSSKKFVEALPKSDESMLNIEALRARPDVELSKSIPRPDVDLEQMYVVGSTGMVSVHVYRPENSHTETLPALIYLHGGGWTCEPKSSYAYICSKFAGETHCAVIFVHYSLSPEVRFPVAIEECYSVLAWATNPSNTSFLKIDATRVVIGGDSAGANLAIAVSLLAKQRELETKLKYQILFYPVTDDTFNTGSYYEFGTDFALTKKHMQFYWDQYVPEKSDRQNILACPMKATREELKDLPPALIIAAEADILRDEAENFDRKLMAAGVPVTTTRVLGVLHGFVSKSALFSDETLFALDMATAALRRSFA